MARRDALQQRLDALEAASAGPPAERDAALAHALTLKTSLVVARAAELIAEHGVAGVEPALRAALADWLAAAADRDAGCRAKRAVLEALYQCGDDHPDAVALYRAAVTHVQREAVWGGSEDTAAELRGLAGLALARVGEPDASAVLAELLADPEPSTRVLAADGLGSVGGPAAAAVLRYKLRRCLDAPARGSATAQRGQHLPPEPEQPNVVAGCVAALLRADADAGRRWAAAALRGGDDAVSDLVAVTLGESRSPAGFDVLRAWWDDGGRRLTPARRRTLLTAVAVLRRDASLAWLLDRLADDNAETAAAAVAAVAIYRDDPAVVAEVRRRAPLDEPGVAAAWRAQFGSVAEQTD